MSAIILAFAFACAFSYGFGDYFGGLATRMKVGGDARRAIGTIRILMMANDLNVQICSTLGPSTQFASPLGDPPLIEPDPRDN